MRERVSEGVRDGGVTVSVCGFSNPAVLCYLGEH